MAEEASKLKASDKQLLIYYQKSASFDFIADLKNQKTLLVGEGNLSFTVSLMDSKQLLARHMVATTFERVRELEEVATDNADKLKTLGVTVLHGIDVTRLSATFGIRTFDRIIFQFPNVGSREPVEGHNPNFILVRDFLKSARYQLNRGGKVLIPAVDSPHYHGAFQFEEAAERAGFQPPVMVKFDPNHFLGYSHTMTNSDESATLKHKKFGTWVFTL